MEDFEQMVVDLATRFIEVAELVKDEQPFNVIDVADEHAELAWYRLHKAEIDWRHDGAS